jgi:hypothetical protein
MAFAIEGELKDKLEELCRKYAVQYLKLLGLQWGRSLTLRGATWISSLSFMILDQEWGWPGSSLAFWKSLKHFSDVM